MKVEPRVANLARLYPKHLPESAEQRAAFREQVLLCGLTTLLRECHPLTRGDIRASALTRLYGSSAAVFETAVDGSLLAAVEEFCHLDGKSAEAACDGAHRLGELLDLLLSAEKGGERRRLGSYYTPFFVARALIERSFEVVRPLLDARVEKGEAFTVCDPACGGGAFLIEAARAVAHHLEKTSMSRQQAWARAVRSLHGLDVSPLALSTARAALFLLAPQAWLKDAELEGRFFEANSLVDAHPGKTAPTQPWLGLLPVSPFDVPSAFPNVFSSEGAGFDWIVGNPPWIAFQGRATQPIQKELRAYFRARYLSFSGYPTTQSMFSERAVELAPRGVVSLLVPSSLSDLDGYAETRRVVTSTHRVLQPLLEFGQDAFSQVVQPCFGLIALARTTPAPGDSRPFVLEERARLSSSAQRIERPSCLAQLELGPRLPKSTFGELGFQSNSKVVMHLFRRGTEAVPPYELGLLEGRCVKEFVETPPRVFMHPDPEALRVYRARLRDPQVYREVDFVVRQTAAYTIAARHDGSPFRNSLIAGYGNEDYDADLLVGLLNSALFRCYHVSRQRDARQATFPQVKVAHLRALPAPPSDPAARARVREVSQAAARVGGLSSDLRTELDQAVFSLFSISADDGRRVIDYLLSREPRSLRT